MELANGIPSKFTYDATNQKDLLYAASAPRIGQAAGANVPVAFTFDHLLAKAYFTVNTEEMSGANDNYTYRVSDLRITNAVKEATYTVSTETWEGTANYTAVNPLTFDHVNARGKLEAGKTYTSDLARLLVPATYADLNITCTIETLYGESVVDVQPYSKYIAQEFVKGYVYNFVLKLSDPGDPIEFTVNQVNQWIPVGDAEIPGL